MTTFTLGGRSWRDRLFTLQFRALWATRKLLWPLVRSSLSNEDWAEWRAHIELAPLPNGARVHIPRKKPRFEPVPDTHFVKGVGLVQDAKVVVHYPELKGEGYRPMLPDYNPADYAEYPHNVPPEIRARIEEDAVTERAARLTDDEVMRMAAQSIWEEAELDDDDGRGRSIP
jgi:hypothetical protein